jgi:superfamily II DNA or RNA helicase
MITLHDFQKDLAARAMVIRRPLVVLPTGAGKTVIAGEIIRQAVDKHVLFIAHRRELIHQGHGKLAAFDVDAGIILAGEPMRLTQGVQVASVQTLWSHKRRGKEIPHAEILFVDEAHHVPARTYQHIIAACPDAQIIGLTATPCRRDGRGLGSVFDEIVEGPQIADLIKQGFLVGTKVYAPSRPDLRGVHTRHGDYVESELAARMDRAELVGAIIPHWLEHADRRKTILFASSVAHSVHCRDEFVKAGVRAEHLDGETPKDERDAILMRLASGDLEVVCNCMVLTEGYDLPDLGAIVLARPTKSMGLFRQMVGRGLRPAPGKDHCLVLDHAGAVFQHGWVEDPVEWTLEPDHKARDPAQEARAPKYSSSRIVECSNCGAIRTAGEPCRHCGFMPRARPDFVLTRDGELELLARTGRQTHNGYSLEHRREFFQGLLYLTLSRGHKPGAAAYRYRDKFGDFPPYAWQALDPLPPSAEVAAWDRHCRIRYAKSMQKDHRP